MKTLICGKGEVGTALFNILVKQYQCAVIDPFLKFDPGEFEPEIMHVTFGYDKNFVKSVKKYQERFKPKYTVIHSTVPVGTSRQVNAIHSPIKGQHPFMEEGIKRFTKFLGGENASEVANYFRRVGLKVYVTDKSEATEFVKARCTQKYALDIEYTKDVKLQANEVGVPFELWTIWTDDYNAGYQKLGFPEFTRPNLVPIMSKQGGHCTIPNLDLIATPFVRLIKKLNVKSAKGGNK